MSHISLAAVLLGIAWSLYSVEQAAAADHRCHANPVNLGVSYLTTGQALKCNEFLISSNKQLIAHITPDGKFTVNDTSRFVNYTLHNGKGTKLLA